MEKSKELNKTCLNKEQETSEQTEVNGLVNIIDKHLKILFSLKLPEKWKNLCEIWLKSKDKYVARKWEKWLQ